LRYFDFILKGRRRVEKFAKLEVLGLGAVFLVKWLFCKIFVGQRYVDDRLASRFQGPMSKSFFSAGAIAAADGTPDGLSHHLS